MEHQGLLANVGRRIRGCALKGMLLAICAAPGWAQQAAGPGALLNKKAPEFSLTDLQHRTIELKSYRGKVVLLNFWATWCAPCQLELPRFAAWQRLYGASGLQILGISMDDDPAPVRTLSAKLRLNYPVAMGDERFGELYGGILGLPVTFLIGRNGEITAEYRGETDLNAMEEQLKLLLVRK